MRNKILGILLPFLLTSLFIFLSISSLLELPVVTNDEAIISDISLNLMHENRMGTDLWKGMLAGVENHAYWIPPLYFYANSIWFRITGFSLQNLRLLNVIFGVCFILFFYKITQNFLSSKTPGLKFSLIIIALLLLLTDSIFLRASRTGRPEMMVLFLIITALSFYIKISNRKLSQIHTYELIISGFFLGLAIITHLISISFFIAIILSFLFVNKSALKSLKFWYFILIFLTPAISWLISIYPNYSLLEQQLVLVSASRSYSIPWFTSIQHSSYLIRINYSLYILISVIFIWNTLWSRRNTHVLLSLIIISTWIFATLGKIYWYTVYPIPFVYIALILLVEEQFKKISEKAPFLSIKQIAWILVILYFLGSNSGIHFTQPQNNSYKVFAEQILKTIPERKTVYLSSLPDAYFIFNNASSNKLISGYSDNTKDFGFRNKLYEWPVLPTNIENHKKILDESDYMIVSGFNEPSNYTYSYIEKNSLSTEKIPTVYGNVFIILLKDKNKREPPT